MIIQLAFSMVVLQAKYWAPWLIVSCIWYSSFSDTQHQRSSCSNSEWVSWSSFYGNLQFILPRMRERLAPFTIRGSFHFPLVCKYNLVRHRFALHHKTDEWFLFLFPCPSALVCETLSFLPPVHCGGMLTYVGTKFRFWHHDWICSFETTDSLSWANFLSSQWHSFCILLQN